MQPTFPNRVRFPHASVLPQKNPLWSFKERNAFLKDLFGSIQPTQPFMLVTRYLENKLFRSGLDPEYRDELTVVTYFGIAGPRRKGLVRYDRTGDSIRMQVAACMRFDGYTVTEEEGEELCLSMGLFRRTPLREAFVPPQEGRWTKEIRALDLASGVAAMEELCLKCEALPDGLTEKYLRAAHRLGFAVRSRNMRECRASVCQKVLTELFRNRDNPAKRAELLKVADMYGVSDRRDKIRIDGLRFCAATLCEDLRAFT